jgi:preprotein translocase subunit YajC
MMVVLMMMMMMMMILILPPENKTSKYTENGKAPMSFGVKKP